jgi:hypothetical protein
VNAHHSLLVLVKDSHFLIQQQPLTRFDLIKHAYVIIQMTLLLLPVKTNFLDHLVVLNGIKAVTASCSHDWIPLKLEKFLLDVRVRRNKLPFQCLFLV